MGRRRRRVVRMPKKRLPQTFLCPNCGRHAMRVESEKDKDLNIISCGGCSLKEEISLKRPHKAIDVYCRFIDKYYEGKVSSIKTSA